MNTMLKISFGSTMLLLLSIFLDKMLDNGMVVLKNLPNFGVISLHFFNKNSFEIIVSLTFIMAISAIIGIVQFVKKYGQGEII